MSPSLLAADGSARISEVPAIQCAPGNWDWKLWCARTGVPQHVLSFSYAFDTDDAALHACVAGLGIALAPPLLTSKEMRSGALVAFPGYEPVEIGAYRYLRRSESKVVRQFCSWLRAQVQSLG